MTKRKRVLAVDDNEDLTTMIAIVLGDEEYEVTTATNGAEALELIGDNPPDLIILDMRMPVMDGWEFARRFHAKFGHQSPILVLTAAADAQERAQEIDAEGWLGKPFDIDELLSAVRQHVHQSLPSG